MISFVKCQNFFVYFCFSHCERWLCLLHGSPGSFVAPPYGSTPSSLHRAMMPGVTVPHRAKLATWVDDRTWSQIPTWDISPTKACDESKPPPSESCGWSSVDVRCWEKSESASAVLLPLATLCSFGVITFESSLMGKFFWRWIIIPKATMCVAPDQPHSQHHSTASQLSALQGNWICIFVKQDSLLCLWVFLFCSLFYLFLQMKESCSCVCLCPHLLLPQNKHSSRSNVMSGCQSSARASVFAPLVRLPCPSFLGPTYTDVLPVASAKVKRQLCCLKQKIKWYIVR